MEWKSKYFSHLADAFIQRTTEAIKPTTEQWYTRDDARLVNYRINK